MSDYYYDATLEDWLAEEVFNVFNRPIPQDIVVHFEPWRDAVEANIESWMDSDDGEGNHLSWRGWGRGFNAISTREQRLFEQLVNYCSRLLVNRG